MHFCLICKTILEIIGFLHFLYLGYGILCSGGRTIFLTGERQPRTVMISGENIFTLLAIRGITALNLLLLAENDMLPV